MWTKIPFSLLLTLFLTQATSAVAQDTRPECGDETIGISCVIMRDTIGPWHIEEVTPPVGTQNSLILLSESFQELPGLFNRPQKAELILSCVEDTTNFEVRFGENFMSDIGEYGRLIYKVDDQNPNSIAMTASPRNDALGVYVGGEAIRLITQLFGAERLLVSATAFTGRTLTASFQIEQLESAVVPFRQLCNW